MTLSNSSPIQLWINGQETFNEKDVCGMTKVCWCQPFESLDNISIIFNDTLIYDAELQIFDTDDNLVTTVGLFDRAPTVSGYQYTISFTAQGNGIFNEQVIFKVNLLTSYVITTEHTVSIDEFSSDMDGWTSNTSPTNALQPVTTYSLVSDGGTVIWTGTTPEVFLNFGEISYLAYIDLSGSNEYSYPISNFISISSATDLTVSFDAIFYFLDSGLSVLGSSSFTFGPITASPAFTNGASPSFTVPSGIGNVKYIALKILNNVSGQNYFRWESSTLGPSNVAEWLWSADDSGSLKVTTIDTINKSTVIKSCSLPTETSFIRIKWRIGYPPNNSGLTLGFGLLDSSNVYLSGYPANMPPNGFPTDLTPADSSVQTSIFSVTTSYEWTNAAYIFMYVNLNSLPLLASDILHIDSIEIYTETYEIIYERAILAKSDCISIKETHPCTLLIDYSNNSFFDGIHYEDQSPNMNFNIRIPAIFFHPENTKESEDLELSDNRIVRLYDKIEEKRLLQIGFMPHYMHRKLLLALSHDFVIIDEIDWILRDEYKKNEGNRHYPLRTATVLLTDKNFIKENQL